MNYCHERFNEIYKSTKFEEKDKIGRKPLK